MVLVLFFIVLIFNTSWQLNSTETMNETLYRLIEQLNLANRTMNNDTDTNKNSSNIFYLYPDNVEQSEKETESEAPIIKTEDDNPVSIIDIIKALRDKSADGGMNKIRKEMSFTVENTKPQMIITNSVGVQHDSLEQMTSKSGRPAELDSSKKLSSTLTLDAEAVANLVHRYPEIVVDKITYHDDINKSEEVSEKQVYKPAETKNYYPIMITQKLKSIVDELQKINAAETVSENNLLKSGSNTPQDKISQDHKQGPCGNLLVPFSSPCFDVLLGKLQDYKNLVNTNLKLARKARTERQNALMINSRAYKSHNHILPQMIRNMPFIHRPLYGYY